MKKINVLVVDDDVVNLKLLEMMLKKMDCINEISKAENGLEALAIFDKKKDINLILLDMVMPVMNGLEFLDNFYSADNEATALIPVIVLTTDETLRKEAFNRGAYDFITKPIFNKNLTQKIEDVVSLIS